MCHCHCQLTNSRFLPRWAPVAGHQIQQGLVRRTLPSKKKIACFITWFILYLGTYQTLEKVLLGMVFFFSVVTLIIAISTQSTSYAISSSHILEGLTFSFPFEHATLALAVFGFTGISYGEIISYTYWCLEKGYAKHDGDQHEVKAWIKVMQTDVWATVFFVTIGTLPFFLLGAAILYPLGLYPVSYTHLTLPTTPYV